MAEFDIDPKQFFKRMVQYDDRVKAAAFMGMNDNRLDLEKEAKNLAPKDEGTLESSGHSRPPKWLKGFGLEAEIGFNTPYARYIHEMMLPAAGDVHPGETTQAKPPTRFGAAGGKYLERPLFGKAYEYTMHVAKKIKAVR